MKKSILLTLITLTMALGTAGAGTAPTIIDDNTCNREKPLIDYVLVVQTHYEDMTAGVLFYVHQGYFPIGGVSMFVDTFSGTIYWSQAMGKK